MMRPSILDNGHGLSSKAIFAAIRLFSGEPPPDILKLVRYRPEFYGEAMKALTHEAMRGPSDWSVADRELMAASVAEAVDAEFCVRAHSAVAALAMNDGEKVARALDDPDSPAVEEPLRSTLLMLRWLALGRDILAEDMKAIMAAGASREQVMDALAVFFAFLVTSRLSQAFDFRILDENGFATGAKILLSRGYR